MTEVKRRLQQTKRRAGAAVRNANTSLVLLQKSPFIGHLSRLLLLTIIGIDVPRAVRLGPRFRLLHGGFGVVLHANTSVGADVTIYHGVTVGRKQLLEPDPGTDTFVLEDGVILCAGAKVLGDGALRVARGTIVAANAVLMCSTGPNEIWAGVPAKLVGLRTPPW